MPARVMRGEVNSSESLSQVSIEADLTFRSLVVVVDDFGRTDGRLPVLKGLLFPLRDNVTTKKLDRWLSDLSDIPDPPVIRYMVDGREYIQLTGWETHRGKSRRAQESKFPGPERSNVGLPRRSQNLPDFPSGGGGGGGVGSGGGEGGEPSALALVSESSEASTGEIWTQTNAALKAYMPRSTGLTMTDARRRRLQKLVKDHGVDAPLAAIHGYAATHLTKPPDPKFDPLRNFNPDTCWSAKLYGKYIDADTAARDAGLTRPYAQHNSADAFRDKVIRMAADVSRRHNQ